MSDRMPDECHIELSDSTPDRVSVSEYVADKMQKSSKARKEEQATESDRKIAWRNFWNLAETDRTERTNWNQLKVNWNQLKVNWNQLKVNWNQLKVNWKFIEINWKLIENQLKSIESKLKIHWNQLKVNWNQLKINWNQLKINWNELTSPFFWSHTIQDRNLEIFPH